MSGREEGKARAAGRGGVCVGVCGGGGDRSPVLDLLELASLAFDILLVARGLSL